MIEARLFDPRANYDEALDVARWCGGRVVDHGCEVPTLEGQLLARPGCWVVRGAHGEFYPCDPIVFSETYERVDDE